MSNFDDLDSLLREEMAKRKPAAKPAGKSPHAYDPRKITPKVTTFQAPAAPLLFDADRFRWLYHPVKGPSRRARVDEKILASRITTIDTLRRAVDLLILEERDNAPTA